ncbi:hypothetical protein [Pseudomonas putida]|uniref:hypothetical protein n=1 Tax=Pseudomonas putida TaxID=303 RepID=UPI0021F8619A|nr:hypothetical protein [Pseudomonas putida]
MTVFYLKLFMTPILMLAISLAGKRWGAQIGGLLSGLPVTSALVMLFLSLEQGEGFASLAVPGALAGVAAVQATCLFYYWVTRHIGAFAGCIAALVFFVVAALATSHLGWVALSVIATLLLVIAIVVATSKPADASAARYVPMPRWVIPMRMMTATLLLLVITASATLLGPVVSGMLAPVPVIAWPLAVFAHVQGGRQELAAIVRGNGIGAVGVVGFYLVLQSTLLQWGAVTSVAVGVLLAVMVTFVLAKLLEAR